MDALDNRQGSEFPVWETLDIFNFNAWVVQLLRLQQHSMLLWGDAVRRCAWF